MPQVQSRDRTVHDARWLEHHVRITDLALLTVSPGIYNRHKETDTPMFKRITRLFALWMLADVRRRIQQLTTSIDVLDREIDALIQTHLAQRGSR